MNKTLTILVCIMVAGVVVGASLPIFDSLTASSESVHNEGAGWVRFALDRNADTTYSVSYTEDENGFYIDNGTDRQTYDDSSTVNFDTILYADSNLSVWVDGSMHILGTNEGNPFYLEGSGALTIVRDADGVTVTPDGLDPVTFGVPTWSYIPVSTGNYGFFYAADFDSELGNGVKNYPSDMPLAVVGGGFAGVYAYNDIYRYNGLGLNMHPVYDEEGLFYGAYWDKTAPVEPESLNPDVFDPSVIDFNPIDIDLDPLNPGAQLMSVPTPTYTEGDWGYNVSNGKAIIVSYSGTGGNIVIPATIGGYDVIQIGKDYNSQVIDSTSISANSTLTITNGPSILKGGCFLNCANITGEVVIPDSITTIDCNNSGGCFAGCSGITSLKLGSSLEHIGDYAFFSCNHIVGELVIPDSVKTIGNNTGAIGPFYNCTGITSLKLGSSVEVIGTAAFYGCSNIAGELVIPDSVKTIGKSATDTSWGAFNGCTKITSIKMGSNVEFISGVAFYNCNKVVGTLLIPSSITTLGVKIGRAHV